jgi:putative transposase
MSRAGCPWDNAMAERWMRTLKREKVDGQAYRDRADAEASIGRFIEEVYNRQRLHSALVSRITLPDGTVIAEFDGLPSSASRVL